MARLSLEHVLCPTDLSEFSERALRHAIALCRWFGAKLTVLRVVSDVMPTPGGPDLPVPALRSPALRQEAELNLGRFAQTAIDAEIPVRTVLGEGDPWREILHEAAGIPADLIVMGTHGRGGFEHLLLGSVAERVVRRAPCPVLTVCRGEDPHGDQHFRRILVATDLSTDSQRTLDTALELAEAAGATLTLVHAIEALPEPGVHPYFVVPEYRGLRERLERDARERLARALPETLRRGVAVDWRVVMGSARRQVPRVAEELGADLVVIGAHARGPLDQLLFGSTCEAVVRQAPCPVLTVRGVARGDLQAASQADVKRPA